MLSIPSISSIQHNISISMTLLSNPQDHHEQFNINMINIFTTFTKFESMHVRNQNQGITRICEDIISFQLTELNF